MNLYLDTIKILAGFLVILIASNWISHFFPRIKLPMITGLLITGIICGPYILDLIPIQATKDLNFVNEISLAFIAFAAGGELYLKELRSRFKNIVWMTIGQLVITFVFGTIAIYFVGSRIPFMASLSMEVKWAISLLAATIFIARSPSSTIAIINETRAKGPFTQTSLGVTVLIDVLVIILFAINFSFVEGLVMGSEFNIVLIGLVIFSLVLSIVGGLLLGKVIEFILSLPFYAIFKKILLLGTGYAVFIGSHYLRDFGHAQFNVELHIEPLLVCIIGSFMVTNYSRYKSEFFSILHETGPLVYIAFFTLTGASISLDIIIKVWPFALILFGVNLVTMFMGTQVGSFLGGDSWKYRKWSWTPFITQAGVGLGLATEVATEFSDWGNEFATIIIAVIVLNQIIGPPLFKIAIFQLKEHHTRKSSPLYEGVRDALIFGLEGKSVALAKLLKKNGWEVKIVTTISNLDMANNAGLDIRVVKKFDKPTFDKLGAAEVEAIVTMMSDKDNYKICELAYENYGTKDLIVRLNERSNYDHFRKLGAKIVEPSTAIVSLLDQFVRSPTTTSLLLGMEESQGAAEIEVQDPDLHGVFLRDLRLPSDIIILSVKRGAKVLISHGYTRLRMNDLVNVIGSKESLEVVRLKFEGD
ncbi:MAG: cation:proton antiporter [Flammeovirgaceae bacterium]|nr:cation:proton antiporter [Flammeovirgaceae bacterium]